MWKGAAGPPRNMSNPVGLETVPTRWKWGSTRACLFQSIITAVSPPIDSHHKWNWKGAGPPRNMSNPVGLETIPTRWKWVLPGLVPEHSRCFPTVDSHHYAIPHRWLIRVNTIFVTLKLHVELAKPKVELVDDRPPGGLPIRKNPFKKSTWINRLHSMVGVLYSHLHLR